MCLSLTEIENELKKKELFFAIEQVYFETLAEGLISEQKLSYSLHEPSFRVSSVLPGLH